MADMPMSPVTASNASERGAIIAFVVGEVVHYWGRNPPAAW